MKRNYKPFPLFWKLTVRHALNDYKGKEMNCLKNINTKP